MSRKFATKRQPEKRAICISTGPTQTGANQRKQSTLWEGRTWQEHVCVDVQLYVRRSPVSQRLSTNLWRNLRWPFASLNFNIRPVFFTPLDETGVVAFGFNKVSVFGWGWPVPIFWNYSSAEDLALLICGGSDFGGICVNHVQEFTCDPRESS
jgi:hypothetical protein